MDTRAKNVWTGVLVICLATLAWLRAGGAVQSPKGAEFSRSLAKAPMPRAIVVPAGKLMPWRYPKSINASNYLWNLQASSDLVHWSTVQSNVSGSIIVTNRGEAALLFRLIGRTP